MALLLVSLASALSFASPPASAVPQPQARAASIARAAHAIGARESAERALHRRLRALRRCRRAHPHHRCLHARRAVTRARSRLRRAQRRAARLQAILAKAGGKPTKGPHSGSSTTTSEGTTSTSTSTTSTSTTSPETSVLETTSPVEAGSRPFEMGVVSGSALTYELPYLGRIGARTARLEFSIATPASQIAPVVEAYARAGVKPLLLAGFYGRIPSEAEARNLGSWAAQFGPGGTFWAGKSLPGSAAVSDIEFGNETSYTYQFSDDSSSAYDARAQSYALRFKAAYEAIHAANPNVGLLAQGDDGDTGSSAWVENMFLAVPTLGQIVGGWTIHPYGPGWEKRIDRMIAQTSAVGAPSTIPIYVTEWGIASDNGRCLSDNYGWNRCMTYAEAANALQSSLEGMRTRYGARLAGFYLFQGHDQDATGASTEREGYFGALQLDEAPKGAYTTVVQSLLSASP
jgi:hypothetical protein